MLFLEDLVINPDVANLAAGGILGALIAMLMAFILITLLISIGIYVYMSLAFMAIAKKVKYPTPGIAWIPGIGPALIASNAAKMHWWPILLLIGFWIPFINVILLLAYAVFFIIWMWKTFEAVGKPGWWAIFELIPIVGLIFIGIAAWSKQ